VQSPAAAEAGARPASLLALALWAGIVTGFAEVGKVGIDRFFSDFTNRSRDLLWMTPAFDGGLFLVVGLLLTLIALRVRVPWWVAAGLFAGLGSCLVLLLIQRLHPMAAVLVGAGIGTQTARVARNRVPSASRMVRRSLPWLAGLVMVLGVATVGWWALAERRMIASRPAGPRDAPNVLLLILDTVRAADLSLYGYARATTPELEAFARRGTVFDRAFSVVSWTLPSHASLFTGQWEFALDVDWWNGLGQQWSTLAEVLHARGYATGAFVANRGYLAWDSGLEQGFERYDDYDHNLWTALRNTAFGLQVYPSLRRLLQRPLSRVPFLWRLEWPHPNRYRSAEQVSESFLAWLGQARPRPFFAFLNFMDAHTPYTSPDSFRFRFRSTMQRPVSQWAWMDDPPVQLTPADVRPKQDMYDGSIAYLDFELGHLLRELDHRGALANTLVIIAADHGEEFAEHGFVDHGHTLYRPSVQVPLLVWFPGRVPEGRRVTEPVTLRNVAATVLDLAQIRPASLPGRSLARFWSPGGDTTADPIVTSVGRPDGTITSITRGGWRYIHNAGTGQEELYDFEHDLLERWNLSDTDSGRAQLPQLRAAMTALGAGLPRRELTAVTQGTGFSGPRPHD